MINWGLMVVTFDLVSLYTLPLESKKKSSIIMLFNPVTLPSLSRRPICDTLLAGLLTPRVEEAKYNFVYRHNPVKDLPFMFLYKPDKLLTKHGPPSADQ